MTCTKEGTKAWIRADQLEDAVMRQLFECFGNPAAVEKTIAAATPNLDKVRKLLEQRERLTANVDKIKAGRQKILDLVTSPT